MTKTWPRPRMRVGDPVRDSEWRPFAACLDAPDPDLFFPVAHPGSGLEMEQAEKAKAVCRRCPVVAACLAWADATGQGWGVFGGLTPNERRAARRREQVAS